MTSGRHSDRGQAFPIYIVVIAGLLFAALAFFVVGRAAITRSDAQGAADAAALAAGREARDAVLLNLDLAALKPADWEKIVDGELLERGEACAAADTFAARNGGRVTQCDPAPPEFTVSVETNATVGDSVIPGTDSRHGTATATASVQAKCFLSAAPTPSPTLAPPTDGGSPAPTPAPTPPPVTVAFNCGGELVKLDPLKPGSLSDLTRKLFSVRLVG
ncbi:pilus assembly protein TadG-related protein [Streptomyces sp. NPDC092307]|uniref:pilus assembly protein TadG-related protein n=1 Tax=Streptomyces sp. NPDC092307 TaxID=3366013 RepID=UPI00381CE972